MLLKDIDMVNNIYQVSNNGDLQEILETVKNRLVVLMFSAHWCGPCKTIKPEFINQSKLHTNSLFIYIDIEDCPVSNVQSLPTFMFYINGNMIHKFEGADVNKLVQDITKCEQFIAQQQGVKSQKQITMLNNMYRCDI